MDCDDGLQAPPLSPLIHPPTPRSVSDAGDDIVSNLDPLDDLSGRLSPLSVPAFTPLPTNASPRSSIPNRNVESLNTLTNVTNYYSPANRRSSVASVGSTNSTNPNPFNFQPMLAAKGPVGGAKPNQRRGHKYKHSSVSHQIFLEPPVRAPLSLPASLPIPTIREFLGSASPHQQLRSLWCLCHLGVAGYVLVGAQGSLAMTALSHLLTFDAMGAMLCVGVDVLSNFEVWKRSTIRHPFGLERAEVLAGFAMSVFLLFMGFDTISHSVEHFLEAVGASHSSAAPDIHGPKVSHGAHTEHLSAALTASHLDFPALAALAATLVSASVLGNHDRIGRATAWSQGLLSSLPSFLSNPSHLLTIVCSSLMLLLPMLSLRLGAFADALVGIAMALSMVAIGVNIAKSLGSMLLLSFGGRARVAGLVEEIKSDERVLEVAEARFWQAHYGLGIGTVRLVCRGEGRGVEEMVMKVVEQRLGKRGLRWEVTVGVVGK